MPFKLSAGNLGKGVKTVYNALYTARQSCAGVGYAVAQRVAGAYFYRDAAFTGELHKLACEGNDKAVEVCARDVFKVTAGYYALLKSGADYGKIFVHGLAARKVHFFEDVIVGAGNQNSGFLYFHLLYELKIRRVGANPAGDLREFISLIAAQLHCAAILFGIEKEFALAYDAFRAAQLMQQGIEMGYLLCRERRTGLLTVAEGGIGYPKLLGSVHGYIAMVEGHLGDGVVVSLSLNIG